MGKVPNQGTGSFAVLTEVGLEKKKNKSQADC